VSSTKIFFADQNATISRQMSGQEVRRISQTLKRRTGYNEDEEVEMRDKVRRMHID
jgi:hypothetical protein